MNEMFQKKDTKKKVLLVAGGVLVGCVVGYIIGYKDCMGVVMRKASENVDDVMDAIEQVVEE